MKIIPYLEISSKIITLIDSAEKELFIVSPYVNIDRWEKLKDCLIRAKNKNVKIWFYVRKNTDHGYKLRFLNDIGINPIFIENLHAKLYVNEKYGIVTSQNLYEYSDIKSIDIGYQTENTKERAELIDFIDKAVRRDEIRRDEVRKVNRIDINEIIGPDYYKNKNNSLSKPVLKILYERFKDKYSNVKFYKKSDYLFSKNLFPFFIEVELDCRYRLFFRKDDTIFEELTEKIRRVNIDVNHNFRLNSDIISLKNFNYLDFESCSEIDSAKLIYDFEKITDKILEILNRETKEEKQQIDKSNQGNTILDEQTFLKQLYIVFKKKYTNFGIAERDGYLFSKYLFPFVWYVKISYNIYTLRIKNSVSPKIVQNIINTFEHHQFKTNIDRRNNDTYFSFEFKHKISFINLITHFEKITDEIIELSKQYERN